MTKRQRAQASELSQAIRGMLQANEKATQSLARRLGVGVTDAVALDHLLSSADGLGPTELGDRLSIRSASATALVDRLQAAGHAQRVPHPSDRRRQTVVATEDAYDKVRTALRPLFDEVEAVVAGLTPQEAATTAAFLRDITAVMHRYATGGR